MIENESGSRLFTRVLTSALLVHSVTPLPLVILFYHVSLQPTSGNIKQQSQGVGGHRVYVGIRHPRLSHVTLPVTLAYLFCVHPQIISSKRETAHSLS